MSGRAVLVPGTHGRSGPGRREWWHADQALPRAFRAHGYTPDALRWTTELDGVTGPNRRWRDAGEKLGLYLQLHPARLIFAHSHGGNLVPTAVLANRDVRIPALVTCGTPVRADLDILYQRMMLSSRVDRWLHVYADGDGWQWWGSIKVWHPSTWRPTRRMGWATDNVNAGPTVGHTDLIAPSVLERVGLWTWLRG
jgi:hypothetical protein